MNWFVKLLTLGWAAAISLAPFGIYVRKEYIIVPHILNHEKIHWKQQTEMLIIFFYIWYILEWLIKLVLPPYTSAYIDISFEKEAYYNEYNYKYLEKRKRFNWIKYIFK